MLADHPRLELSGVSFSYRSAGEVLSDVSLTARTGATALIGLNGAGKSTLLRIITGTLLPHHGTVHVFGRDRFDRHARREINRRVGYMPQTSQPPLGYTVESFMHYMAWLKLLPKRRRHDAITSALNEVGLERHNTKPVRALSGGQWRRLLLAQAILGDPELLVLDEPTVALDPKQRRAIRTTITTRATSCAVLMTSHELDEVEHLADHVLVLDDGSIAFDGTLHDLLQAEGTAHDSVESAFHAIIGAT